MDWVDLVTKAQHGDRDAFADLVRRFEAMAFGYAYSLLGDFHLAEDATQDAFLQAYRDFSMIAAPKAFPAWLRRVVFKHSDRLRRRKGIPTVPLDSIELSDEDALPVDERLIRDEMRVQAEAALAALPKDERAVFLLYAERRYRQREIADFLELSLNVVKHRLRAARRKLYERTLTMTREMLREETPELHERFTEMHDLHSACERGDVAQVTNLLRKHPDVLDSPDRDTRAPYPECDLWSPLYLAAMNGHKPLVRLLLDMGANPVPYEVAAQYHQWTYEDWMTLLRERGYDTIANRITDAIEGRYGPLVDDANLHQSVHDGDIDRARTLITGQPDRVTQVDAVGNTVLHTAVNANNLEMVRLLIDSGSDVDRRNGDGRTPSVVALFGYHRYWQYEEKPEILEYLLENGAEYTILIAATVGDEARVRELLRADPSQANALDPCYRRPLSVAAGKGHTEIVRLLLERGADPNAKESISQGGQALYLAANGNHLDIAKMLLDHGANPVHWIDSSGDSLFAARHSGHEAMVRLLCSYGAAPLVLDFAANYQIEPLAALLKVKPSLADEVLPYRWWDNGDEETALAIMQLAVRYGARFENADQWKLRNTVIKHPRVFQLLLEYGADPNSPLLRLAGDRHSTRVDGDFENKQRAIRFLIEECGADVNCRDKDGFSPLARASEAGYVEIVEYLLSKGADATPGAPEWVKPLHLAEKNGHTEIAELLRRHAARR